MIFQQRYSRTLSAKSPLLKRFILTITYYRQKVYRNLRKLKIEIITFAKQYVHTYQHSNLFVHISYLMIPDKAA